MIKILAYLRLVRLPNLLIMLFALIGWRLFILEPILRKPAILPETPWEAYAMLALSVIMIMAGAYALNDYHDYSVDLVNKPHEQPIGRLIPPRRALLCSIMCTGTGVLSGIVSAIIVKQWMLIPVFPLCAFLLWQYTVNLQKMPLVGNIAIAFLTAFALWLPLIYEKQVYTSMISVYKFYGLSQAILVLTAFYSISAFVLTLLREIVKDVADMEGDQLEGYKTLPIVWGITNVKWLLGLLNGAFVVAVSIFLWDIYKGGLKLYAVYLFVAVILPLVYFQLKLPSFRYPTEFNRASLLLKVTQALGVLSMPVFYINVQGRWLV